MSKYNPGRLLGYVENALMAIAATMLMTMLGTMVIDATGRYVFNKPFAGNFEFMTFFGMVILTFLAIPKTYTMGGHIRLHILQPYLRKVPYALPQRINAVLIILCFGAIALYAGEEAIEKIRTRETTIGLVQIPIYISFTAFPIGCAVLCLRLILELFVPVEHEHNIEDEL